MKKKPLEEMTIFVYMGGMIFIITFDQVFFSFFIFPS